MALGRTAIVSGPLRRRQRPGHGSRRSPLTPAIPRVGHAPARRAAPAASALRQPVAAKFGRSAPLRNVCRALASRRETCICEHPMCSAISVCVNSSKNRRLMTVRSRSRRAAISGRTVSTLRTLSSRESNLIRPMFLLAPRACHFPAGEGREIRPSNCSRRSLHRLRARDQYPGVRQFLKRWERGADAAKVPD